MNKVISVVAMCAGSFLLGGSLGLAMSDKKCETCNIFAAAKALAEHRMQLEELHPGYWDDKKNIIPEDAYVNDDNAFDAEVQSGRVRYNRETGKYESFEADEEVISTVEDLVQSYIPKDEERPELEDATDVEINEEPVTDDQEDSGDIIIVSTDSYLNEYEDYDKNTLTYYAGDDILVDSRDDVVFDTDEYIGPEALDKFGEGSDDENVVYVRNFKKKADYEIIRDEGTFRETVLGYTSEYKLTKKKNLNDEESEE